MTTNDTPAKADEKPPAEPQVLAFAVPHQVLTDALAFVVKGLPKHPSVPVLTGVLVEGDANGVTVAAFDYEQARWYTLEGAHVTQPGRLLVSAKRLTEMVKKLRKDAVVGLAGAGAKARLTDGKTNYALPTMPVEDYPTLPDMPPVVGMVDAATLLGAAVPVASVAGRDETLPMMTGVRLEGQGTQLSVLATDRYRLEHRDIAWENGVDEFAALIPAVTLVEFVKPLAKLDSAITLYHASVKDGDNRMGFEAGPARAYTRLLDGENYPPVRSLFPADITAHADVPAKDMLDAIGRVELAAERTTPVLLDFTASGVRLSASDGEAEASDDVEAAWVGPDDAKRAKLVKAAVNRANKGPFTTDEARDKAVAKAKAEVERNFDGVCIGFNPAYLAAGVKLAGTPRVRFNLVDAFKPAVILPLDDAGKVVPHVRHLLMPIRAQGGSEAVAEAKAAGERANAAAALESAMAAVGNEGAAKPATRKPAKAAAKKASAAAPAAPAEPVAGAGGVLDRNTPHEFVRAVDNGKPVIWATKCLCGTTFHAKVHRDQGAGEAQPAAEPVAVAEPVDERPWLVVMTLAERIGGRLTTVATDTRAAEALRGLMGGSAAMTTVVDGQGKRTYVGAKDEDMAKRMQQAAMGKQVPARIERGELPKASAKEVPVVAGEQVDVTDPRQVSEAAFVKFGSGDYEGALELIEAGMEASPDFEFEDETGAKYGWDWVRNAVEAKQIEAGINAQADDDEVVEPEVDDEQDGDAPAEAEAEAEPAKTCGRCKGTGPKKKLIQHRASCPKYREGVIAPIARIVPNTKPAAPRPAAPVKGRVDVNEVERLLAKALAGQPADVVAETVAVAKAKLSEAAKAAKAAPARPAPAQRKTTPAAKPAPAAVKPAANADTAAWSALGMTAPSSATGERVYVLPRGTRIRAARKEVLAALTEAFKDGELAEQPKVDADRDERPVKLRVRFGNPGALTSVVGLVDEIVASALPAFLPERANA